MEEYGEMEREFGRKRGYEEGGMEGAISRGFKKRSRMDIDDINPEAKIMRKLFVKNFPPGTTEDEIKEYFEKFGSIEKCTMGKTKSEESVGYCFLVFEKAAGVDETQLARPHTFGENELITKREALEEDKQNGNVSSKRIFIGAPDNFSFEPGTGGLDDTITDDDLKEYFGQFGIITQVIQLIHKDSQRKKGVGYIYFEDEDSVDKIVLIGAHIIKGRALEAKKALSEGKLTGNESLEQRKQTSPKSRVMRRLFLRNLTPETTVEDLKDHFGQFGEILDADIPINKHTGKKATYGFLTYATMEQADDCMKARPHTVSGKEIMVKRAMDREHPDLASCLKIFLGSPGGRITSTGGLNDTVSDDDLKEYFGQFGTLTAVRQIRDKNTNKHKGVGFIEYQDTDSVDKVVLLRIHEINDRQVEATKALTDQQRREQEFREREKRGMEMSYGMDGTRGFSDYSSEFGGGTQFGTWRDRGNNRGYRPRGADRGYRQTGNDRGYRSRDDDRGYKPRGDDRGYRPRGNDRGYRPREEERGYSTRGDGRGYRGKGDDRRYREREAFGNRQGGYNDGNSNMGFNERNFDQMGGYGMKGQTDSMGKFDEVDMMNQEFLRGGRGGFTGRGTVGFPGGFGGPAYKGGNAASQGRKLLIEGLKPFMNEQMLSGYFHNFGEVVDWGMDKYGGGYVVFADSGAASVCLRSPNHNMDGHEIFVAPAQAS